MKIAISAESTIDLTEELIKKYDIKIVPFTILLGEETKLDTDLNCEEIFEYTEKTKTLPKTSAVNEYQYEEHFNNILKDYEFVIHLSLSSEMSSACSNAKKVAENLKNVFVIDTKTLSTGIALLAIYARELADKGESPEKIVELVKKRVSYVQASFVLKRLDYLYKGGRCSSLQFFGANLLKLRPQIIVKDGKMGSAKKYRGNMDVVVENYCKDVLREFYRADKKLAFLTYTTATEGMLANAKSVLENAGFKTIYVTQAKATIASHCGENTLGILFINDKGVNV